ncbi:MAG: hypothetical protein LBQ36_02830 [Synergistaceae bacterium]|jgi:hypothetical protein|nr:hypothetical protein [Synergistaceae bacterium]
MREDKKGGLQYLVWDGLPQAVPCAPYSEKECAFVSALSEKLIALRRFPDVVSFAFFCRKANIARLKREFDKCPELRLGRGTVFHITPSNIPINFAFSLVFGMLSGNANIVRVPTKPWQQVDAVCGAINELLALPEFRELKQRIAMVRYGRDDGMTGYFSENCDARVVWGGDDAVNALRKIPIPPRAVEMAFADRYSFCALDERAVASLDDAGTARLAENFYNDTYLVDQNACSSPNLIVWLGAEKPEIREKFWRAVCERAAGYRMAVSFAMDKYSALCECLADGCGIVGVARHGNLAYRVRLSSLDGVEKRRGKFGLFFEYDAACLDEIAPCVTRKWQTMTYFGIDEGALREFVEGNALKGIDRIAPVGSALDIGVMWDGFDIIRTLSRVVDVR